MKIKAIIPAAGFGTRFLPATKAVPKELLPIIDKPAIQYIVEEGISSSIKDFIIITSKNKKAIEDHFDSYHELEKVLKARNKIELIKSVTNMTKKANFMFIRQRKQLGLGDAIYKARSAFAAKEHVAIFLPDDIYRSRVPAMAQLMKIAIQEKCNVIAVQEVAREDVSRYGIIDVRRQFSPNLFQVKDLIEKPTQNAAPSNLAIVGRYVLSSNIFESLEDLQFGSNQEIQLTDGIKNLILDGEKVFAYKVQGQRYDVGTTLGWLKTNIEFAIKHPTMSADIIEHLSKMDREFLVMQGKAENLAKRV